MRVRACARGWRLNAALNRALLKTDVTDKINDAVTSAAVAM